MPLFSADMKLPLVYLVIKGNAYSRSEPSYLLSCVQPFCFKCAFGTMTKSSVYNECTGSESVRPSKLLSVYSREVVYTNRCCPS